MQVDAAHAPKGKGKEPKGNKAWKGKKGKQDKGKSNTKNDKGKNSKGKENSTSQKFNGLCNVCGKWGHKKSECWWKKQTGSGAVSQTAQAPKTDDGAANAPEVTQPAAKAVKAVQEEDNVCAICTWCCDDYWPRQRIGD